MYVYREMMSVYIPSLEVGCQKPKGKGKGKGTCQRAGVECGRGFEFSMSHETRVQFERHRGLTPHVLS